MTARSKSSLHPARTDAARPGPKLTAALFTALLATTPVALANDAGAPPKTALDVPALTGILVLPWRESLETQTQRYALEKEMNADPWNGSRYDVHQDRESRHGSDQGRLFHGGNLLRLDL